MFGRKKMAAENRNMHMGVESPNKEPSLAGSAAPVLIWDPKAGHWALTSI